MSYVHTVKPGSKVLLKEISPDHDGGLTKEDGEELSRGLGDELCDLQELLYAAGQNGLLVVLQGLDTSGKDGTIRSLLSHINGQSCSVSPFKVPTPVELSHDFLWRVHAVTPGHGHMTIFNRSHYEDVLVVRVHNLVPESVWSKRYDHINHFEKLLADSGVIVLKYMLHISKEEQEQRLLEREQDVEKAWKLSVGDWKEREYWKDYTEAYEAALTRCSTEYAPWHVVPANKKWFRNLAITEHIVKTLKDYREPWMEHLTKVGEKAKAELTAWREAR